MTQNWKVLERSLTHDLCCFDKETEKSFLTV